MNRADLTVGVWRIAQTQPSETTGSRAVAEQQVSREALDALEAIAQIHLGHTLEASGSDRGDFFQVNVIDVKAAMRSAFLAGMQFTG